MTMMTLSRNVRRNGWGNRYPIDSPEAVALRCAEKFWRHARMRFVDEYVSHERGGKGAADSSSRSGESVCSGGRSEEQYDEHRDSSSSDDDEEHDEE